MSNAFSTGSIFRPVNLALCSIGDEPNRPCFVERCNDRFVECSVK